MKVSSYIKIKKSANEVLNLIKSPKIKNYPTNFFNFYTKKNVTKLQIFKLLCSSYEKKIDKFK